MKKISPHIITLTCILLINIAVISAYVYLFTSIKDKNRHVSITLNEIEAQTQKNTTDEALRNIVLNTKADRDTVEAYVLDDDKVVDFINIIESLGPLSHTKVTIAAVNENSAAAKDTGFLTLQVNVVGDFKSMMQFASLTENLPYKITIDNVTMSSSGTVTEEVAADGKIKKVSAPTVPTWQANFDLRVVKEKK